MSYYNTTGEDGGNLKTYRDAARKQDDRIGAYFRENPDAIIGASQVWTEVFARAEFVPITSVRRSINTLYEQGVIEKTAKKTEGAWGRLEYCWRLAKPKQQEMWER